MDRSVQPGLPCKLTGRPLLDFVSLAITIGTVKQHAPPGRRTRRHSRFATPFSRSGADRLARALEQRATCQIVVVV